jgi:hypothetical protein
MWRRLKKRRIIQKRIFYGRITFLEGGNMGECLITFVDDNGCVLEEMQIGGLTNERQEQLSRYLKNVQKYTKNSPPKSDEQLVAEEMYYCKVNAAVEYLYEELNPVGHKRYIESVRKMERSSGSLGSSFFSRALGREM